MRVNLGVPPPKVIVDNEEYRSNIILETVRGHMSDTTSVTNGSLAPDFTLSSGNGTEIRLTDFRARNHVVLFFIREYY